MTNKKFPVTLEGGYAIWESKVRRYVDLNYGELIQADIRNTTSDKDRTFETGNETAIVPLQYIAPNVSINSADSKIQPLIILTDVGQLVIEIIKSKEDMLKPDVVRVLEVTSREQVVKNIESTFARIATNQIHSNVELSK